MSNERLFEEVILILIKEVCLLQIELPELTPDFSLMPFPAMLLSEQRIRLDLVEM